MLKELVEQYITDTHLNNMPPLPGENLCVNAICLITIRENFSGLIDDVAC